jgi:predicted phosphoribosyltransferase
MFNQTAFKDRHEAGQQLAQKLMHYADQPDVIVLGLPRGGVPVAYEVATALRAPLDVWLVRKLGTPGQRELAMGAIAFGDIQIINSEVVDALGISEGQIARVAEQEQQEIERRSRLFRSSDKPPEVEGRQVIVVDDGLATGASMSAAVNSIKQKNPARLVVAVPTASPATCNAIRREVDEMSCLMTPEPFISVGSWYVQFSQTSDDEVRNLLARAAKRDLKNI